MSTYTTNDGIEQPAIGSQPGTWGNTLNNNFALIDQALDGVAVIDLTGLSSYTLNIPQGAAGNGRSRLIRFTGSPIVTSNFPVTITPNTAQKLYVFQAGGLFSLRVSQGSGDAYTVGQLRTACLYCDGGGSGANVYGLFGGGGLPALQVDSLICDTGLVGSPVVPQFIDSVGNGSLILGDGQHAYDLVFYNNAYIRGPYSSGGNNLTIANSNTGGGIKLSPAADSGVQIGAAASAPTDANLPIGSVTVYLDETGNNIKFRVRKSDGTYKTATLSMV